MFCLFLISSFLEPPYTSNAVAVAVDDISQDAVNYSVSFSEKSRLLASVSVNSRIIRSK